MSKQKTDTRRTHWVLDPRKLPDGVVAVCEKYGPAPGKNGPASFAYRAVDSAWIRGEIWLWKCGRYVGDKNATKYVLPADADRVIESARNAQCARRTPESISTAMTPEHCQAAIVAVASRIIAGIGAIREEVQYVRTDGVESVTSAIKAIRDEVRCLRTDLDAAIATLKEQPKTPQQELVSTFESNGFHQ